MNDDLDPRRVELARRIRAAIAYDGRTLPQLAKATGIAAGTLGNMTKRTRPNSQDEDRVKALARETQIPLWFFRNGFDLPTPRDVQLDEIEGKLDRLLTALGADDESSAERLAEASEQAERELRAGTPRPKPAARKRAPKNNPRA